KLAKILLRIGLQSWLGRRLLLLLGGQRKDARFARGLARVVSKQQRQQEMNNDRKDSQPRGKAEHGANVDVALFVNDFGVVTRFGHVQRPQRTRDRAAAAAHGRAVDTRTGPATL